MDKETSLAENRWTDVVVNEYNGQVEGPNTLITTRWYNLPNPVWHLLKGVNWPDG